MGNGYRGALALLGALAVLPVACSASDEGGSSTPSYLSVERWLCCEGASECDCVALGPGSDGFCTGEVDRCASSGCCYVEWDSLWGDWRCTCPDDGQSCPPADGTRVFSVPQCPP
jgi:hypothetical protein